MKMLRVSLILLVLQFFIGQAAVHAEVIHTKDGEVIQGEITEVTVDTIWVEMTEGDITEYTGIDKTDVEKILNDAGSISKYSPTYSEPSP